MVMGAAVSGRGGQLDHRAVRCRASRGAGDQAKAVGQSNAGDDQQENGRRQRLAVDEVKAIGRSRLLIEAVTRNRVKNLAPDCARLRPTA
ncbi:hypothetical protein GV819_06610 [Pseudomonas sp. Fl5BN2]|uniref:hypothetical protein n=1 Tax=unclassified Pseudomonas TaxID=196821 RepID=UPI001376611A|nr:MULTISPECIES: hypothetical protein [unclassified Pseudomonas]NBF01959.1 hypothetical protein [Pseudomonas sp. Fl5BN2]NBF08102.1 hypothetical protein [Pseudomonas sp. Fl4BN1]